jgi:hypothetical protein
MRTIAEVKADILGCIKRGEHAMEAGFPYENPLNDLQRELIAACAHQWGECWLGNINLYHCRCDLFVGPGPVCAACGKRRHDAPVLWQWKGETVLNFGARFAIPRFDLELQDLIVARDNAPYTGTAVDYERVKEIHARIAELGGETLLWN